MTNKKHQSQIKLFQNITIQNFQIDRDTIYLRKNQFKNILLEIKKYSDNIY